MHLDSTLSLRLGQASMAGLKPVNEDSVGIRVPDGSLLTTKGAVAVIADGVSAAEAGKEASDTCVTNFLTDYYSTPESWTVKKSAHQVLTALNRWLYGQGQKFIQAEKGYVCTLSIIIIKSRTAHIFHVGDSRIYRMRDGDLEQLTRDHSIPVSEEHSYLSRAMGMDSRLDIDYKTLPVEEGDLFFLSTDGVHDFLQSRDLREQLRNTGGDFEQTCNALIAAALENQSGDNLSCQMLRVDALPKENANDVYRKLTELPFPPSLAPGMVLDGYKIEKEIHASSRSQLYRVRDTQSDQLLAMKTPSPNFIDDPAYIERFVMESWIGKRIDHPQVMKVLDDTRPKSCLYYVSELVEGRGLNHWISEHPKPAVEAVIDIAEKMVKGLVALHRKDTVHQDLKPDNIMLSDSGSLKIVDLGACHVGGVAEIESPISQEMVVGTASYSSPEHKQGRRPSPLADQYSLAVIIFEMLTGKLPFQGKLEQAISNEEHSRLRYVPAYEYNPHVPVWMDAALSKAMSVSPDARYHDVYEFLHDLQHPNPQFMAAGQVPLAQRNPLKFWQLVSALSLLGNLLLLSKLL